MPEANGLSQIQKDMITKLFNPRYRWLKKELKKINYIINTFGFKYEVNLAGKSQIREGIRMDYDRNKEKIDACIVKIGEEEAGNKDEKIISEMKEFKTQLEKECLAMEEQMKELDLEIKETEMTKESRVEAARAYRGLILKLLKK